MSALRDLVADWEARQGEATKALEAMVDGTARELDAVGGYATTSPDEDGYCRTYTRAKDWPGFYRGRTKPGDLVDPDGTHAPVHPEVGDRCEGLQQAWRWTGEKLNESAAAVQRYVKERAGDADDVWRVAAALVMSEAGERAAIVNWLRTSDKANNMIAGFRPGGNLPNPVQRMGYVLELAKAIERGDHLHEP